MDPLHSTAEKLIPFFIQLLKHLDPQVWAPLRTHQQKIICFQIEGLSPFYFQITPEGLSFIPAAEHSDVTFSGPLTAFMSFVLTKKLSHQELHIRGDLECAKAFYEVWDHLDIDWEGHLATLMGPSLARVFYHNFKQTKQWVKETWEARQQDVGIYFQDEIKVLPSSLEIEGFFQAIEHLRDDVERLDARIKQLQKDLAPRE